MVQAKLKTVESGRVCGGGSDVPLHTGPGRAPHPLPAAANQLQRFALLDMHELRFRQARVKGGNRAGQTDLE